MRGRGKQKGKWRKERKIAGTFNCMPRDVRRRNDWEDWGERRCYPVAAGRRRQAVEVTAVEVTAEMWGTIQRETFRRTNVRRLFYRLFTVTDVVDTARTCPYGR